MEESIQSTIHALLECQHALCLDLRYQMWQAYHDADPALENYIKSSLPMVATRVMTGLQLLDSAEANASLLKVAVLTLCKNYTEAGLVERQLTHSCRKAVNAQLCCSEHAAPFHKPNSILKEKDKFGTQSPSVFLLASFRLWAGSVVYVS